MSEIGKHHVRTNRRCIFGGITTFNFDFPHNVVADEKLTVNIKKSFCFIKEHETTASLGFQVCFRVSSGS